MNKETNTNKKGKVLAVVSLILGLVSIEYTIMGFFLEILSSIIYVPIICSILAIILGILSFKAGQKRLAIVGIVIGVLSIAFLMFSYIMYNRAEYAVYIQESKYENMPLEINPKPDMLIRVLMTFKGLDRPIEVEEQKLETPERNGFVTIEWGGTEIK